MDYVKILDTAREHLPYMTEIRRHLHKNPGVGFDNRHTMEYISEKLSEQGITSHACGRCGLWAMIGNGEPCFLLRADTDGLPITEETGLPFASENGNMHACGHDLHTAQLLGAARILKNIEGELCGSVKLMFQSAEETLEGARDMINGGILLSPVPQAGMMIHVMSEPNLKCGTLIVPSPGESAPAADFFTVTFTGKGCHGSSPVLGKDPIYAACATVCNLSEISSRELGISDRAILTICSFTAGTSGNVIPEKAILKGTLRCFGEDTRDHMRKRLCEISQKTAEVFGTTANVTFTSGCPSLLNDTELCDIAYNVLSDTLGKDIVLKASELKNNGTKTAGSEDFAYIGREIPTVMLALSAGTDGDGVCHPLHSPKLNMSEQAMVFGCAALALTAAEYLKKQRGI